MNEVVKTLDLLDSPSRFFNRELSWLEFNMRVLEEARNPAHPLLERVRFLSISGNNLDEFFMVRVAGLVGQLREQIMEISQDGLSPAEQLEKIRKRAQELMAEQDRRWLQLKDELKQNNIEIIEEADLTQKERDWTDQRFLDHILPIVTPIAIDPAHPFPFILNRGFVMAVQLRRKRDGYQMKALLPIPSQLERFVRLPGEKARFMLLENMLSMFLTRLFPGYEWKAKACSASFVIAISISRKKPKIWCGCLRQHLNCAAVALSSAWKSMLLAHLSCAILSPPNLMCLARSRS